MVQGPTSDEELRDLLTAALPPDLGLSPLDGFAMNLSANRGFRKVYFSAGCRCGTAALLSVEVSEDKTPDEVSKALPSLVGRLEQQARSFSNMSCDDHRRMRLGPAARPAERG